VTCGQGRRAAFLSVGNWVERKGTLELLEAFAGLDTDSRRSTWSGATTSSRYTERVRDASPWTISPAASSSTVRCRVVRSRLFYASADAFVLPSVREPYGTVYGEAMAFGLPVVGWRAGNLPNLAVDGSRVSSSSPATSARCATHCAGSRSTTRGGRRSPLPLAAERRRSRRGTTARANCSAAQDAGAA
jgi:glycosyltransferase involved in cell wall biosynthesis